MKIFRVTKIFRSTLTLWTVEPGDYEITREHEHGIRILAGHVDVPINPGEVQENGVILEVALDRQPGRFWFGLPVFRTSDGSLYALGSRHAATLAAYERIRSEPEMIPDELIAAVTGLAKEQVWALKNLAGIFEVDYVREVIRAVIAKALQGREPEVYRLVGEERPATEFGLMSQELFAYRLPR